MTPRLNEKYGFEYTEGITLKEKYHGEATNFSVHYPLAVLMCRNKLYNRSAGGFIGVRNPADLFIKTILCFYADIKLLGFRQEKKFLRPKSGERDI
jgi:hypothetical protein